MTGKQRPESLEGRWDILYRDYPEVYEEWGKIPKLPSFLDVMLERFPLRGKTVVDVASGSGISTLSLAPHAELVIGIEPERAMMELAAAKAREQGVANVRFEVGVAEALPLADDSVDAAIAFTAGSDVEKTAEEMERVVRPGGFVLRADVAPGWYGGDVNRAVAGEPDETPREGSRDYILAGRGYDFFDVPMVQEYDSVEQAVLTYGFIHGKKHIDYIREHNVTTIRWKARARFKTST
jgi:ubiquinone/menaquinone biosynthesis C-methylase UbiE